jgi:hypothetical protein
MGLEVIRKKIIEKYFMENFLEKNLKADVKLVS